MGINIIGPGTWDYSNATANLGVSATSYVQTAFLQARETTQLLLFGQPFGLCVLGFFLCLVLDAMQTAGSRGGWLFIAV